MFGARQTARLEVCEGKRKLAVDALDLHNAYVDKLVSELAPKKGFWDQLLHH